MTSEVESRWVRDQGPGMTFRDLLVTPFSAGAIQAFTVPVPAGFMHS